MRGTLSIVSLGLVIGLGLAGCETTQGAGDLSQSGRQSPYGRQAPPASSGGWGPGPVLTPQDGYEIVKCQTPPRIMRLGNRITSQVPGRIVWTGPTDCATLGGAYVAFDRTRPQDSLAAWEEAARTAQTDGDKAEAHFRIGWIKQYWLNDPAAALASYQASAALGSRDASVALAQLYSEGRGVAKNPDRAAQLYAEAAGITNYSQASAAAWQEIKTLKAQRDQLVTQREAQSREIAALRKANQPVPPKLKAEQVAANKEILATNDRIEKSAAVAEGVGVAPPAPSALAILMEDPVLLPTRGTAEVRVQPPRPERRIAGRVDSANPLKAVFINGQPTVPTADKRFITVVEMVEGGVTDVLVKAEDRQGKTGEITFRLDNRPLGVSAREDAQRFGRYRALLIANTNYTTLRDLSTPGNDVAEIERVLRSRYGFTDVTVAKDVTGAQLLRTLFEFGASSAPDDNLFVYYAGHGEVQRQGPGEPAAFWQGVDAAPDNSATWVPVEKVTNHLFAMKAKRVFLVVDTCYAGFANAPLGGTTIDTAVEKRARLVFTSTGRAQAIDQIDPNARNSVFATALIAELEKNQQVLSSRILAEKVGAVVFKRSREAGRPQRPTFAALFSGAGSHEAGGDFFLVPRL